MAPHGTSRNLAPDRSELYAWPMLRSRSKPAGFIEPCMPSPADRPPTWPGWSHEIKHDGFRMLARRAGDDVRLMTRNAIDWTPRFPLIVQAVAALSVRTCLIDGEAVCCDENGGVPVFNKLRNQ